MDLETVMQKIEQKSTTGDGCLDRDRFMFLVATHFYLLFKDEHVNVEDYDVREANVHIRRILGNGYNLTSCLEFTKGKRGQCAGEQIRQEISLFTSQNAQE